MELMKKISAFATVFALAGAMSLGVTGCSADDEEPELTPEQEAEYREKMMNTLPPDARDDVRDRDLGEDGGGGGGN